MTRTLTFSMIRFRAALIAIVAALTAVCLVLPALCVADQVIIADDPSEAVSLGDNIECSTCDRSSAASAIELLTNGSGGEVTAGQLWRFFKAQGVTSMDELMLQMDVDGSQTSPDGGSGLDISSLQFQIENPGGESCCTDVNIGDKQVLLPQLSGDEKNAAMQLAVKLDYDFMERFSADSPEKIRLNVSTPGVLPSISIGSKETVLGTMNWPVLIAFTLFWVAAFAIVNWLTKPEVTILEAGPALTEVTSGTVA
jgi:hypothetical protein